MKAAVLQRAEGQLQEAASRLLRQPTGQRHTESRLHLQEVLWKAHTQEAPIPAARAEALQPADLLYREVRPLMTEVHQAAATTVALRLQHALQATAAEAAEATAEAVRAEAAVVAEAAEVLRAEEDRNH